MEEADCVLLASLHRKYFDVSMINDFGEKFLRSAYEGMTGARWGRTLVCTKNGEIIGFATVVFDVGRFFLEILSRRGIVMGLEVAKAAWKRPALLKNVMRAVRYPSSFTGETRAELLTLIAREDKRGVGTGSRLMGEVMRVLAERGFESFKVSVKKNWTRAVDFYVKRGFEVIGEIDDGSGGLLFLRYY